jgi:hypothetical protein
MNETPTKEAMGELYQPLQPFQTRIIRLHSEEGPPDTPIVCSLYVADILHPRFRAVGLRSLPDRDACSLGEGDTCSIHQEDASFTSYDALSYTWGSRKSNRKILCNGLPFPVTDNLFDALSALRRTRCHHQCLWIDAICINQDDDSEKSYQVQSMFSIYQNATSVIAWLGLAEEKVQDAIKIATASQHDSLSEDDLRRVRQGLSILFTNPWFERMWVQQEIFSSRQLVLQYGADQLDPKLFLSRTSEQIEGPLVLPPTRPENKARLWRWRPYCFQKPKPEIEDTSKKLPQLAGFKNLSELRHSRLGFFRRIHPAVYNHKYWFNSVLGIDCDEKLPLQNHIYPKASRQLDLIDTLMDTGVLKATDPRDYIYAIMGMTGFPAKKASIEQWMTARNQGEIFIPIDYTADLKSLLCIVTWVILMRGGLSMLAKFKVFGSKGAGICDDLPSWVIDWQLSARCFRRYSRSLLAINLESIWHNPTTVGGLRLPDLQYQRDFCVDNRDHSIHHTRIFVQGFVDTRYFADRRHVWSTGGLFGNRKVWALEVDLLPTDLVVYLSAAGPRAYSEPGATSDSWISGGLWLLRPAEEKECYSIVAFLAWPQDIDRDDMVFPYPGHRWEPTASGLPEGSCRRLAVKGPYCANILGMEYYKPYKPPTGQSRQFIIV